MSTERKIVLATPHISFIISRATKIMQDYVLSKFNQGFFKDMVVGTEEESIREMNMLREKGEDEEYMRKTPTLFIRPNFSPSSNGFTNDPLDLAWKHLATREGSFHNIKDVCPKIFIDSENEKFIIINSKEISTTFDFAIRVESELKGWDVVNYLKNYFIFESFFYLNKEPFSIIIPSVIIANLAKEYKLDLSIASQRDEFLSILKGHSYNCIDEIVNPATGVAHYVFTYRTNLLCKLTGLNVEKVKKEKSVIASNITFQGSMNFRTPINFALECTDPDELPSGLITDESMGFLIRFERVFQPNRREIEGKQIVYFKGFMTDSPETIDNDNRKEDNERCLYPIKGTIFSESTLFTNNFIPFGWNFNRDSDLTSCEEDSVVKFNEFNTWGVETLDSFYELKTDLITFERKGEYTRISLIAAADRDNFKLSIQIIPKSNITKPRIFDAVIPQANVFTNLEFDVADIGEDCYISLTPEFEEEQLEHKLWIAQLSVKDLYGQTLSSLIEDFLYLEEFLSEDLNELIDKINENNLNPSDYLLTTITQKYGKVLKPSDFSVDWKNKKITLLNPLFNYTHFIAFYADLEKSKELLGRSFVERSY
jgi:hypothetical protein